MEVETEVRRGTARVLSYNFNILPRCCSGYQHERIDKFLQLVDSYDVILLQEVYAASILPHALQKRFCFKKMLLDGLKNRGFNHYVTSRQPSYSTMLRFWLFSDSGLIVASRYPIHHRGSYTFRNRGEKGMSKGCIFAEIDLPFPAGGHCSGRIVFFNVHLGSEEQSPSNSSQVQQMVCFVNDVLKQLGADENNGKSHCPPFVIAGDFNIQGIQANTRLPSKTLNEFMSNLQPLGNLKDVIMEEFKSNPPTRPPQLFFPTRDKLERMEAIPQRQDYFLIVHPIKASNAGLEKFVTGRRRPYAYLSDHFGITVLLSVPANKRARRSQQASSQLTVASFIGDVDHEQSNTISAVRVEVFFVFLVMWITFVVSFKPLCIVFFYWLLTRALRQTIFRSLNVEHNFALVTNEVLEGKAETRLFSSLRNPLPSFRSLAELWERSVRRFGMLRCLGATEDMGKEEWLSYAAVDVRAREVGAGLLHLGVRPGDLVGVACEACHKAAILDIACILYGFVTVGLAGKGNLVRSLLDKNGIKVVFSSRAATALLLTCRSTSLETIVHFHSFVDNDDLTTSRDLNINLISFENLEHNGRLNPQSPSTIPGPGTFYTYSLDNSTSSDLGALFPMTHATVLRDMSVLLKTDTLPDGAYRHSMLWFSSFTCLFNRLCVLGLLSQGGAIATTDSTRLQKAFLLFKPTLLVASPSMFYPSHLRFNRAKKHYIPPYNWILECVYQLHSRLIHVKNCDLSLLRLLFYRSFQRQLGGNIQRIVLNITEKSSSFSLIEHISVCYSPYVREVSYINSMGLCTIDGIPSPNLRVILIPMDTLSKNAQIGELVVTSQQGQQRNLHVAARWEKNRTLTLLGNATGVLWPVDYHHTISKELESAYTHSRYVNNIFIYCAPLKPLIAVVYPNRDTLEYEWRQCEGYEPSKPITWSDLVDFAPAIILKDLESIATEQHLHHSQRPHYIHLHPHSFRDHATFLTPFGTIRRESVTKYFSAMFDYLYSHENISMPGSTYSLLESSSSETHVEHEADALALHRPRMSKFFLHVPVTIDIGGTFTKIAYIMPPNMHELVSFLPLSHEASSLSEKLGWRTFAFFANESEAERELEQRLCSLVGTLRFGKIPSKDVPQFAEFLREIGATSFFKPKYIQRVRATGGGAFKYASLVKRVVGVDFEVIKEMEALVKGLNMIIQQAPDSIFTVDSVSGEHLPHQLVGAARTPELFPYLIINIGSGISFIKCLGPDGSHVRVGGSPIGGATFWGLVRTMTHLTSWEEVLEIMRLDGPGDNKNVDLLVGDIYGYNAKDLPARLFTDTVASSFGKFGTERFYASQRTSSGDHFPNDDADELFLSSLHKLDPVNGRSTSSQELLPASSIDIVRSLLNMIASNVTQLAYLQSKIHGVKNIFFTGGFVRNNPIIWSNISASLQFWSSGEVPAHFIEHDGYLGALGCMVYDPSS